MRISKRALLAHKFCPPQGDARYSLQGVKVESDGSVVATDGHKLLKYQPILDPSEHVENQDAGLEPFILPAEACQDACRRMRGKSPVDAELDVPETNANGVARLIVAGDILQPAKLDGSFPKYENIMPDDSEIQQTIGLGVKLAADIFATLKQQGFETVEFSTLKDKYIGRSKTETADRPVKITAKDDSGKVTVVWMPVHLGS